MLKRITSGTIALLLLIALIGARCSGNKIADANIIIVPSSGYETIQKAINAASPGDIISVKAGAYRENLVVNKSVSIIGENPLTTIIDGHGWGTVITITSPNVVISGFTIRNGTSDVPPFFSGISVFRCNFAVITNNVLKNNDYGLQLAKSNNSRVFNNSIIDNPYAGVYLHDSSSNNAIFQNTIRNNFIGLWITSTPSNTFYHNNLLNNTYQLQIFNSPTVWDNGAEGNYWSDYVGADVDMDGIGDSEYTFAGDKHPLMGTFTNFTVQWRSQKYFISTISNSTISNFHFDESQKKISFNVSGQNGAIGFCRIAMLTTFVEDFWQGNYTVLVDDNATEHITRWASSLYTYSYFTYEHTVTARKVTISLEFQRDNALPPIIVAILSSIVILTIALLMLRKKKKFQAKS